MSNPIGWCEKTWNPCTGCTPVSEACEHCYALRMLGRNLPNHSGPEPTFHPDRLEKPLHWRKPQRIFVNSMSDLFHEAFTYTQVSQVLNVAHERTQHDFLVLTKRPERMREVVSHIVDDGPALPNLHLGVTVENQQRADERIPILLDTPAAVRFISLEPMLGAVDLERYLGVGTCDECGFHDYLSTWPLEPDVRRCYACGSLAVKEAQGLDMVILGGETGPGARPMQPEWALDVYRQCKAAGVAFWFKQWAARGPIGEPSGETLAMTSTRELPTRAGADG